MTLYLLAIAGGIFLVFWPMKFLYLVGFSLVVLAIIHILESSDDYSE